MDFWDDQDKTLGQKMFKIQDYVKEFKSNKILLIQSSIISLDDMDTFIE